MINNIKEVESINTSREKNNIVNLPNYDKEMLEDIGLATTMTFVMMCNYHQTGHFGGPTAYTPYVVASHLAGPENGLSIIIPVKKIT
jgi:hypothetical protein